MSGAKTPFLTVPRLAQVPWLVHGFGGGGWSEEDFLDFAASGDMRPVIMRQAHSDTIHRVADVPKAKLEGDALMTNVPGLLLVIRTADCLPVLLVDPRNRAVAAVHCGWRGTAKRILEKAVRTMGDNYGTKPGDLLAAFGPCIGATCYEVGPEVRDGFLRAGFPPSAFAEYHDRGHVPEVYVPARSPSAPVRPGRSLLDLRAANFYLLEKIGLRKSNVHDIGAACTHCEPSLLSYRRDPRDPRRMYNFIGLSAG